MSNGLILEVISGFHNPVSRKVGDSIYWSQTLYADVGKPFPIEIKMSVPDHDKGLPVGRYELQPSAFQAGKYGDLEINRFEMSNHLKSLAPVSKPVPQVPQPEQKKAS
jgi:hypothetical protein